MITVGILRCDVCGAPMYPNPAKQAFCCPFCGNVSAYGMQQSRMKHEHRKLEFTEEGYFSLKRVAILTPVSVKKSFLPNASGEPLTNWCSCLTGVRS